MKWQSAIILFVICLNLATGLVIELGMPGTAYISPSNPSSASEYESQWNATEIAEDWTLPPTLGIPIVGDIWSGFSFLTRLITYVIVGFPLFLGWVGDWFVTGSEAMVAWNVLKATIVALFSVVMATYFIWFISGRDV